MSNNTLEPEIGQLIEFSDQICFAIYSASNALNRAYQPYLSEFGLTYPQYITLSTLWQKDGMTVTDLCSLLKMRTDTLAPILQRLETRELITREGCAKEGRPVIIRLTAEGKSIQDSQHDILSCIIADTNLDRAALDNLIASVTELRDNLNENNS